MSHADDGQRRLRVLHLIDGLGTGGSERSLAEMLAPLAERGIDGEVACLHRRPEGVEAQVRRHGFAVHHLPNRTGPRIGALRRLLGNGAFDVLHTVHLSCDLLGRWAARGTPVRVLTSQVNERYGPHRVADPRVRAWKLEAVRRLDAFTARRWTDHFHAVSQTVADSTRRWLGIAADRVTVVPRGRDPHRLATPPGTRRRIRGELGLDATAPVLLNVGRREFQKGQEYLLTAFARLAADHPDLVLLVAGRDGSAGPALDQRCAELGLTGRVRFLGHRDDVPALLAAADLFVFPSLYEGLPGALLEALGCATPVVASDIGPVREVVADGESARLVPPADPLALATAVASLLADPETAAALAKRGRRVFHERFTLERSVDGMARLYRRLVPRTEGSP